MTTPSTDSDLQVDSLAHHSNHASAAAFQQTHWRRYLLILLGACLVTGGYCCELNRQLYTHHHPFYDSLSYNEKLFRVMTISHDSGILSSLETACFENNTNCLPFIVAAAIGPWVSPSRFVGVWIQTGLLFLFLASLYYYLIRIQTMKPPLALAGCLVFLVTKCLFVYNGGLSDFRMDLSLYLAFSMTCIWYLASVAIPTKKHFLLLGTAATVACLFRAIAPVYLVFSLAPLAIFELIRTKERARLLRGFGLASLVVIVLSGWFYLLNFEFLQYYYTVWNTDANAKIPIGEAMRHWFLAQRSVGELLGCMILCWCVGANIATRRHHSIGRWIASAWCQREIDWRIGWLAIAPVLMLVARRAGLNPFVTMPAVFGMVLFFTLPLLKQTGRLNNRFLTIFIWTTLTICLVAAFARGWTRHSRFDFNSMAAQQQIIDEIVADAETRNRVRVNYGVMQLTDINTNSLYSTLLFDRPDGQPSLDDVKIGSREIHRIAVFSRPAKADWASVDGRTDSEKIETLIDVANASIDYLILPDEKTAKELELTARHNYINHHLVAMRDQIVSDDSWIQVGSDIPINESEIVQIYRKQK